MFVQPIGKPELHDRMIRVQKCMRKHELDALVVASPPNFRYFTGLDSQFWESPTRPFFLVLPAKGEIIAVVPSIGGPTMAGCGIADVRTWPSPRPEDEGVSLLSQTLLDLPKRFGKFGFELGKESSLRMPAMDFLRLRENLGSASVVDGSPCLWEVRAIKSAAEISLIRASAQCASRAFENLPNYAHIGMSEQASCLEFTVDVLRQGAHAMPFLACATGENGYSEIISRPTSKVLREGDVLFIDVGATIHGYFCDFDRNYAAGKISSAAARAQDAVWLATEAGIKAARPGAKVKDLWQAMMAILEPVGVRGNNVGRIGHGLGLQITEPPSIRLNDDAVLEAGMVMTIEPGVEYAEGKMIVHEENIAITEDGVELLTTRTPREMPTLR